MGAPSLPPAWQLYLKDHRVSTFKNWPFLEGCACTPERVRPRGLPGPLSAPPGSQAWPPSPRAPTPALGDPSHRAPTPPWVPGTGGDSSRRGSDPAVGSWDPGRPLLRGSRDASLPGSEVCSPLQMAAAGFIHCPTENEPDLAQCFFCFKELEGWEPDDDPM